MALKRCLQVRIPIQTVRACIGTGTVDTTCVVIANTALQVLAEINGLNSTEFRTGLLSNSVIQVPCIPQQHFSVVQFGWETSRFFVGKPKNGSSNNKIGFPRKIRLSRSCTVKYLSTLIQQIRAIRTHVVTGACSRHELSATVYLVAIRRTLETFPISS